jgi:hypothetical protein
MLKIAPRMNSLRWLAVAAILFCPFSASLVGAAPPPTGPSAQHPYSLSPFAKSTDQYSQPDSIVQWRDTILVGFQNHVAKDGSDGKSSTIVQYSLSGKVLRTFSVPGHNDGLRIIGEDDLWALQNEDANPNLVVIELESGHQKMYTFAPTVHGGGYDDMVVKNGRVLMSASNPNLNGAGVNVFPALVVATLHGNMVDVEPILSGDGSAVDIPTGTIVSLNLTDPDSMTIDPRGNIVLNSQADAELIFIQHPFSATPTVGHLGITCPLCTASTTCVPAATTVDDTAFASNARAFMLFSDVSGDTVYRLDSAPLGFEPGTAYSTSDTCGIVGVLNLDNGVLTPVATGFKSTRGMIFVAPDRDDRGGQEDR